MMRGSENSRFARQLVSVALTFGLAGAVLAGGAGIASAVSDSAYGSWGYYTVAPTGAVQHRAGVSIDTNGFAGFGSGTASSGTRTQNLATVPSGWLGAQARLYTAGESAIKRETTWQYNTGAAYFKTVTTSSDIGHYIRNSKGRSQGWNGAGYKTVNNTVSPNLNS